MAKLPKALIKKYGISKKAWSVFRSRKHGSVKNMPKRKRYGKIRRYSPRRYSRHFRRGKAPVPALPLLGGVVAPVMGSVDACGGLQALQSDPLNFIKGVSDQLCQRYAGFSPFPSMSGRSSAPFSSIDMMIPTYAGLAAGIFGHWLASKSGVNRYIRRIPIMGKYVSL